MNRELRAIRGEFYGISEAERKIQVEDQAELLRIRNEARRIVDAEERAGLPVAEVSTLAELLKLPPEPPYRITPLIPSDASTLVVAQRKAGKTTFLLNLAASLLTGQPLLGTYATLPVPGTIAVLNFEVAGRTFARWADDRGLDGERLLVVNLRGRSNPLADDHARADLAAELKERNVETLLVDPFGRAYTGASQNDAGEVGSWLVGLDQFARELVGARDLVLSVHAGWTEDGRVRGSSALEDWPDSIITLKRDLTSGMTSIGALGRDVEIAETVTAYDPYTRTITLGHGHPAQHRLTGLRHEVHQWLLGLDSPASRRAVESTFPAQKNSIGEVLAQLAREGLARNEGDESRHRWVGIEQASEASEGVRSDTSGRPSDRPYKGGHAHTPSGTPASEGPASEAELRQRELLDRLTKPSLPDDDESGTNR